MATALNFEAAYREAKARAQAQVHRGMDHRPHQKHFASEKKTDCMQCITLHPLPVVLKQCTAQSIRYMPNFVGVEYATYLLDTVRHISGWRDLKNRRLLSLGGTPHPCGSWSLPLPRFLQALALHMAPIFGGVPPNQVLINDYAAGQGIDAHKDGPLYEPVAAVISLDSAAMLDFLHDDRDSSSDEGVVCSLLLEPRSLVIFSGAAYCKLKHQIASRHKDVVDTSTCINVEYCSDQYKQHGCTIFRGQRLSLTFRRFSTVTKVLADGTDVAMLTHEEQLELQRRQDWFAGSITE